MAKTPKKAQPKGRVVEAVMSAGGGGAIGNALDPRAIEDAMAAAVEKAYADGVTDSAKILKLKEAARQSVKAEHKAAEKKAAQAASE